MPPSESLSHSAVRDPIQSVLVQRYRDVAVVTTRFAKSIGVDRKMDSRGHLLEVSVLVKNYPADAVLVAYYRFKDVQNRGKIHLNPTGHSTVVREAESGRVMADLSARVRKFAMYTSCAVIVACRRCNSGTLSGTLAAKAPLPVARSRPACSLALTNIA